MKSCTFFGHSKYNYYNFEGIIKNTIVSLIKEQNVTQFYCGGRGHFDNICSKIIYILKDQFPYIKNTLVLSYHPNKNFILHPYFDDSVYLLEKTVPLKFAISHTNKRMIDISDYIVFAVDHIYGGAYDSFKYAKNQNKIMINIFSSEL